MTKNYVQHGFEKRLETLEQLMKKKDDEIVELKSALRSVEKNFADEIKERDAVITDLFGKFDELKSLQLKLTNLLKTIMNPLLKLRRRS